MFNSLVVNQYNLILFHMGMWFLRLLKFIEISLSMYQRICFLFLLSISIISYIFSIFIFYVLCPFFIIFFIVFNSKEICTDHRVYHRCPLYVRRWMISSTLFFASWVCVCRTCYLICRTCYPIIHYSPGVNVNGIKVHFLELSRIMGLRIAEKSSLCLEEFSIIMQSIIMLQPWKWSS